MFTTIKRLTSIAGIGTLLLACGSLLPASASDVHVRVYLGPRPCPVVRPVVVCNDYRYHRDVRWDYRRYHEFRHDRCR